MKRHRAAWDVLSDHLSMVALVRSALDMMYSRPFVDWISAELSSNAPAEALRMSAHGSPGRFVDLSDWPVQHLLLASAPNDMEQIRQFATISSSLASWEASQRQVVVFDADLLAALESTDEAVELPAGAFSHLPWPAFAVVFADAPMISDRSRCDALLIGPGPTFCGFGPSLQVVSLERSLVTPPGVSAEFAARIPPRLRGIGNAQCHLPLTTDGLTIASARELVVANIAGVLAPDGALRDGSDAATATELSAVAALAVRVALYLSSMEPDLVEVPADRRDRRRGSRPAGAAAPVMHDAGFRIGSALRTHRAATAYAPAAASGRTVAPHVRKAHYHTVVYGPGRRQRRLQFFGPIPVNVGRYDGSATVRST